MSGPTNGGRTQLPPRGLSRLGRDIAWELRRWAFIDRGGGLEDTVFLAGSGRSGTTWIEELLNRSGEFRVLFEPFWGRHVPAMRPYGEQPYMRVGSDNDAFADIVKPILEGRVRNRWFDHHNTVRVARRRLVKEIRANNWVGWAADRWPQITMLFVIRHPLAVAMSSRDLGWCDGLQRVLSQQDLMSDHFDEDTQGYLRSLTDPWERSIARWCAENAVPFRTLGPGRATLLVYEALVTRDEAELDRLLGAVGQVRDTELQSALSRPSRLARAAARGSGAHRSGAHWFDRIDPVMRKRGLEVVSRMGFGDVYGDSPNPDVAAAHRLWGRAEDNEGP